MHLQRWVAFGTLLAAAFHAHAGQPSRTPDPADPATAVPAITYQSALAGYTPYDFIDRILEFGKQRTAQVSTQV